ncbi:uncharacterized protein K489DRAFT_37350 [Dissoconium aciculare CBS 342.82]|uniref:Uncharacterized protein n=1 Tax=Dissoconium aciculare CBS 342.82 TaxID=1314786 RepID=A0A6J3LXW9_9PEZI|nr:uncharacterized protein K489DRAFT_37350 [Dissoconium aciculare CBS 342.82]KAF1820605.1 hypothetical protein K489DRAFT_37350 [Dissoconium aciculare CBS 342.82]
MPPRILAPQLESSAPLAASCFTLGPAIWWIAEYWASRGYYPSYSYIGNFTSDLAVPYPFAERPHGRKVNSTRASFMKYAFYAKAIIFAVGNLAFLRATTPSEKTGSALVIGRGVAALTYSAGMLMFATVPGGPREHEDKSVFWHSIGGAMSMIGGNLSSILLARAETDPNLRRYFTIVGSSGLFNIIIFILNGRTKVKGLWQRGTIYTVQAFEIATACLLWSQIAQAKR